MSTPQDGLANVIADVSIITAADAITATPIRFQVGPFAAPPAVAGVAGVGLVLTAPGILDLAIDVGKGAGPVTPAASLQCEFSVEFTGTSAQGVAPMMWTVTEKTAATASTANIRIFTFHFFNSTVANPTIVTAATPIQCTITVRRKKELYPQ